MAKRRSSDTGGDAGPRLSLRQSEILSLLMAGKANKEIASELGISLGTVKQHVVALFKKLDVTSRSMAISRGFAIEEAHGDGETPATSKTSPFVPFGTQSAMELRPATILSLTLGAEADAGGWSVLRDACAGATATLDTALSNRPGEGIDVIFGRHHADQDNASRAVGIARAIAHKVAAECGAAVRAGLASGYLAASMHRRGGWTGEVVVGKVIAAARLARDGAACGQIRIDTPATGC